MSKHPTVYKSYL